MAVPVLVSSPGAVHETKSDDDDGLESAKLLTVAGGVVSGGV